MEEEERITGRIKTATIMFPLNRSGLLQVM